VINFMAELTARAPGKALPSPSPRWGRGHNIYELYTGPRPGGSYWEAWGGTHDNIESNKLELYYDGWLFSVKTEGALLGAASPAMFVQGNYVYIHIPWHPWLYGENEIKTGFREGSVSGPLSVDNPADLFLEGSLYEARLAVPSISARLSDPVSGLTKYTAFSFSLDNADGRFDGEIGLNPER
jgi:hypothetical protein